MSTPPRSEDRCSAARGSFKQRAREQFGKWFQRLAILVFLLCCPSFRGVADATEGVRRVLIIYEAGSYSPLVNLVDQGIRAAFNDSPYRIEFYRTYLETAAFPDPADQQLFRDFYVRKFHDRKPDVIIAVGPSPLQFMVETHQRSFAGVPVIFCLPNRLPGDFTVNSDFTGVRGDIAPAATLDVALRLRPGTKHVVVVSGTSPFDKQQNAQVKDQLRPYEARLDISYLTDLTIPDLLRRLSQLPTNTIILLGALGRDAAGDHFTTDQSGPMIVGAANAPVFSLNDRNLNHGEVGGSVSNATQQGRIVGSMALRILNGERPQDISAVNDVTTYMFDWRALKRWGLKEGDLPPGSIVLNRQPTIWEGYKWYIIGGSFLILVQTLLILGLVWQRSRAREAETKLVNAFEAVRESEARFRQVANTAPVMIWMSGPDKLCTYFNQPWLEFTGRPAGAQLGNGWAEGVHGEDLKACLDTYTQAFERREPFKMQYRRLRNDGEYRWVFDTGVPRLNLDGSLAGYIGSCLDITERKTAEDALTRMGGQLIEAQEEERKRIAREIHDDYTQRLAMMAIDLEALIENIGQSSVEAGERLHDLFNRVSELGTDLHSLSHRLHSSTLETLGLVAGVRGFCEEFAEQQGMQVDYAHENVPHGIPRDVAVCIFRIAQEGLRNVKRHSGVNRAEVRLEWLGEKLHLSVTDQGKGFNPNQPRADAGIGIRSMQERLRVLGGHVEVHSRPREGVRIDAWLPLKISTQRAG